MGERNRPTRPGARGTRLSVRGSALAIAALLAPLPGLALTSPAPGAVALPADLEVQLPFLPGEECAIGAGYGPDAGSTLHFNTDNTAQANDHHALDLVLPLHPENGRGQPVVAAFAGTVVAAGWALGGWGNYGQRVIVRREHDDGHAYTAVYAHLNAVSVSAGQLIERGAQLGELGDSCNGDAQQLQCPSFEAHLHWVIHRDSVVADEGASSGGGNAVVPEPVDGYEDLAQGQALFAGGVPPQRTCPEVTPALTILEDDGPCFLRHGPAHYWRSDLAGLGGHCFYTYTIDAPAPDNWGEWTLRFAAAGRYALRVYIPESVGQSLQAGYVIRHAGQESRVIVSQAEVADDWVALGRFDFAAGGDQGVSLADNTGEASSVNVLTAIAFDALELAPAPAEEDGGTGPDDAASAADAGSDSAPAGDAGFAVDAAPADASADGAAMAGDRSTPDRADAALGAATGCNCALAGGSGGAAPLGLLLGLAALARRRSTPPRRPLPRAATAARGSRR